MSIAQFFHEHPVFSYDTFCDFKQSNGITKRTSVYQALHYYIKVHKIIMLRKRLYAAVPAHLVTSDEPLVVDPYLLASIIADDGILAYHTALELHGVSYSNFQRFTFLTSKKIRPFEYNGQLFQPVSQISALKKLNHEDAYVVTINKGNMIVRVTSIARTYVDALDRPDLCGGWEEVCRAISNIAAVDIDEIIDYCLMLGSTVLCAKVGFFLDQRKDAFAASDAQLNKLLSKRLQSPYYITRLNQGPSKLIKKWNIMVPYSIFNNSWEEPGYDI